MSNINVTRGKEELLTFTLTNEDASPYDLTGKTVTWAASNRVQSLSKTATVATPASGVATVQLLAADTSTWPDFVAPLAWSLMIDGGSVLVGLMDVDVPAVEGGGPLAYFARTDLTPVMTPRLLARLSADTGDTADDSVIEAVIGLVCSEMDKALRAVMTVPVTGPADLLADLKTTGVQMFPYYLYMRKGINENEAAAAAALALWRKATKDLDAIVKAIAEGKRGLSGDPIVPASVDPEEHWGSEEPLFYSPAIDGDSEGS